MKTTARLGERLSLRPRAPRLVLSLFRRVRESWVGSTAGGGSAGVPDRLSSPND